MRVQLDECSIEIRQLSKKDKRLAKVISLIRPLSFTTHDESPYAFMAHEIIEQMLSIKAAAKIFAIRVYL